MENTQERPELTPELFRLRVGGLLETVALQSDQRERAESFTAIMRTAREFGMADEVFTAAQEIARNYGVPEFWELPKPFDERPVTLAGFPVDCLPETLSRYLKEVSANIQVSPDMAVLPMLSVLSLCTQGKALIRNPGGGNTETLNLYTLTVAEPGERKSGVFKALTAPLYQYQKEENQRRDPLISDYKLRKSMLTKQLEQSTSGKGYSPDEARKISAELDALQPVNHLTLNVTDTTPEALADIMSKNEERIGILNDEGGIFDILSGMYSRGTSNIDLFLKAYDGSPYNVMRCGRTSIELENPLITFGLMAQTEPFERAMGNPQFSGRGLVHRFLYAFPASFTGNRGFTSPPISDKAKSDYKALIYRLLGMADSETVIECSKKAGFIFADYHDVVEFRMNASGAFEYMKEWANKQVGRALKIAGILHLCEHNPSDPLDEKTAQDAVSIAYWTENQAMRAFGEVVSNEEYKDAKYVWGKIKKTGLLELSRRDILRICRKIKSAEDIDEPLTTLEDMGYIREIITDYSGMGRKPAPKYKVNPYIA